MIVLAAARFLKQPQFEALEPTEVKKHESKDPLADAAAVTFATAEEACSYCYSSSFTRDQISTKDPATGQSQCLCLAFPGHEMYCATPNQLNYAKEQGACMCVEKNMEQMGATTCGEIP